MILVISNPNTYASKRLLTETKNLSLPLKIVTANKIGSVSPKDFEVLYVRSPYIGSSPKFLPKVIALAKKFKAAGKRVVDANVARGNLGLGKWEAYKALKKAGLPIPRTRNNELGVRSYAYPLILKWIYGFKARQVYFVNSQNHFKEVLRKHPKNELLVQDFIKAAYEYKIITVGYKALPVALKFDIKGSKFRVNFKSGRKVAVESLPKDLVMTAEKASKVLGRELAKVDILEEEGKFYILEVNRCPGFSSFEKLTNYNVAKDFLKYLQK